MAETQPSDARHPEVKGRIFISYSRRDSEFTERLEPALKACGFEPLIDRRDIAKFEDWWQRIAQLIVGCDTVLFVLSPDAIKSAVCQREVDHARSLNKRLAPILWRAVEAAQVPEELRRLNWIDFQDDARFEDHMNHLAAALESNIEWIRRHTQFGESAVRWQAAGRPGPSGLMLRPPLLTDAEAWLGLRPRGAPEPTELIRDFLAQSREAFDQEQMASEMSGINLLARVGDSERLLGNLNTGLRLCVHAARRDLDLQRRGAAPSRAGAFLAAAVWRSHCLLTYGVGDGMSAAALSPDGTQVAKSADRIWRIWDVASGQETAVLRGHEGISDFAEFSPDGSRIVTASFDGTARIWDAARGIERVVLRGHQGRVLRAVFSSDGRRVVTIAVDNTARTWDAQTGRQIATFSGHTDQLFEAVFSPDGSRVATASSDRTACIWHAATGDPQLVLRGHERLVGSVGFSLDQKTVVTGGGDNARAWSAATGEQIAVLNGHQDLVHSARFSRDGRRVLTASEDGTARIWDVRSGSELAVMRGHERPVVSAVYSGDETRVVTASMDETARIWDAGSGEEIASLRGHENVVASAAFTPDGSRVVTTSWDSTTRLWDGNPTKAVAQLSIPNAMHPRVYVHDAVFSADGSRIFVATSAGPVRVWDSSSFEEIDEVGYEGICGIAVSPDGSRVATVLENHTVHIYDIASRKELAVLRGHEKWVRSAAFSRGGTRMVTASDDATVRIWHAASGRALDVLRQESGASCAAFSPDGARIVTAAGKTGRVLDAATGSEIVTLGSADRLSFSPDGSRICGTSRGVAAVWEAATGRQVVTMRGHTEPISAVAFSPKGTRIVSGSNDRTARIWDAAAGQEIFVFRGHQGGLRSATFSPDGRRILTAGEDMTVRIWDSSFASVPTELLITDVCTRRLRGLTKLRREEMRLAGYPDTQPELDVCEGCA